MSGRQTLQRLLGLMNVVDATSMLVRDCLNATPKDEVQLPARSSVSFHEMVRAATLAFFKLEETEGPAFIKKGTLPEGFDPDNLDVDTLEIMLVRIKETLENVVNVDLAALKDNILQVCNAAERAKVLEKAATETADALHDELNSLRRTNKDLESRLNALTSRVRLAAEEREATEAAEPRETLESVAALRAQNKLLEEKVIFLREALRSRAADAEQMERELEDAQRRLAQKTATVERLEEINQRRAMAIPRLRLTMKNLRNAAAKQPRRIHPKSVRMPIKSRGAERRCVKLRVAVAAPLETDLRSAREADALHRRIIEADAENERLTRELQTLRADMTDVICSQGRIGKLTAELKLKTATVESLRKNLSEVEAQLAAQEDLSAEAKDKLAAVTEELRKAQAFAGWLQKQRAEEVRTSSPPKALESTAASPRNAEDELEQALRARLLAEVQVQAAASVQEALARKDQKHQATLKQAASDLQRRERELQRQLHERLSKLEEIHHAKILEYQDLMHTLENRIRTLTLTISELEEKLAGPLDQQAVETAASGAAFPEGEFSVVLPGTSASVSIPLYRFRNQREIVIHVALPPQRLSVYHKDGRFSLRELPSGPFHAPLLINMRPTWG